MGGRCFEHLESACRFQYLKIENAGTALAIPAFEAHQYKLELHANFGLEPFAPVKSIATILDGVDSVKPQVVQSEIG